MGRRCGGGTSPTAVLVAATAVSDVGFALDFVCLGVF
jgi:hypothetical protein